jgi:hypothetical protein
MKQPYDPSSSHDVERRTIRLRFARQRSNVAFARMMDGPEFRAFVWDLLAHTHVFESSFDRCPQVMAFREGERNVGLAVLDRVNRLCPERYRAMADEAAQARAAEEREAEDGAARDVAHEATALGNDQQEDERHDD